MRFDLRASPPQRMGMLIEAGIAVVFTSAPELSATYALDSTTLEQIRAVASDAAGGLGLPFGAATFNYPDKSSTPEAPSIKAFTAEQIQALYKTMRDYMAGLQYYATGQVPDPPPQPVTID